MAVRCVRCGDYMSEVAQYCENCTSDKRRQEENQRLRATIATSMPCPTCSIMMSRSLDACPSCGHDFTVKGRDWSFMEPIGFGSRLVSWFIDEFIVISISGVLAVLSGDPMTAFFLGFFVGFAYYVGFIAAQGATPGKMVMGTMVISDDRGPVSILQAASRYMIFAFLGIISAVFIFFNPDKKALHDTVAGTMVVRRDFLEKLSQYRDEKAAASGSM